jgi:hypothetical protein
MSLWSALKNDLKNTEIRKLLTHTIIIFVISIFVTVIFSQFLSIEKDTLFWLGGTITMAFGALIAMILVLSSTQYQILSKNLQNVMQGFNALLSGDDFKKQASAKDVKDIYEKLLKTFNENKSERENIFYKLHRTIQSLATLIGFALVSILINGVIETLDFYGKNSLRWCFSILLILYSFYCLHLLIKQIYETVNLQREKKS